MQVDFDQIWKIVKDKPNVVGLSKSLKPRVLESRGGAVLKEEKCIQVKVSQKIPEKYLFDKHVIPSEIDGVPTDVITVGELEAPPPGLERKVKKKEKTDRIRPVIYGTSVGNLKITAGTLGWAFEKDGEVFHASNSHVFCDGNPSKKPDDVKEKRIIQPGSFDEGTEDDVIGQYHWHKRIIPFRQDSACRTAKWWAGIYNSLSKLFHRRTRLVRIVKEKNRIDFAVAEPIEDWNLELYDFNNEEQSFVGLLFAGSEKIGVVCKAKYIEEEGYTPVGRESCEVKVGSRVEKSSRTSCHNFINVTDESAIIKVSYGSFIAEFDDVIITSNNGKQVQGGDSGSSVWLVRGS